MFAERIRRRHRLFWKTRRLTLHGKGRCLLTYLDRTDPPERWRCCELWQRKLANKWNAREFAEMHGCSVPELYWSGRNVAAIPFGALPPRYVVRPVVGHSKRGVFVMIDGLDLVRGRRVTPAEIVAKSRRHLHPLTRRRVLVEAFVEPDEPGRARPVELKCWSFGERIAAITWTDRYPSVNGENRFATCFFDERWQPLRDLHTIRGEHPATLPPPPRCLAQVQNQARTLGRAYGTFCRIDFYASAVGAVFSEFAPTPLVGAGFTESGDRYLEQHWQETFPDRI
jgi:hypothetical protein